MVFKRTLKMSLFGLCSGVISGLAAITPACSQVTKKPEQIKTPLKVTPKFSKVEKVFTNKSTGL
jgi:hypothetical protein